jgi:hypothetical protein
MYCSTSPGQAGGALNPFCGSVGSRRRRAAQRRHILPRIEGLETRITPSTVQWTGQGADTNWMTAGNWTQMPQAGDDLVFPDTATNRVATNNFSSGTNFGSIEVDAANYTLSGASVSLTNGISTTYTSATSTDEINTTLGGGTISVAAGGTLDISGQISGSAGLAVSGGGTVDLIGMNTYSGATMISGTGTALMVNGQATGVQVNAGTTLSGIGTVGDVSVTSGTVSPGNGAGTAGALNTASLTLDAGSTFDSQLDGSGPGQSAEVVATGPVDLGGATLNLSIGGGYVPALSDQLTIIQNLSGSAVTGQFSGFQIGSMTVSGTTFQINYAGGATGHDVVLTVVAPTTTQITPSTNTSTYGDSLTFTAVVSSAMGTPTGTVDFYRGEPGAGGVKLGSAPVDGQGDAVFPTTSLTVSGAPYQIYAVYQPGSSDYATSVTTQPASVTITRANLTITVKNVGATYGDGTTLDSTTGFTTSGLVTGDSVASVILATDATNSSSQNWNVGTWSNTGTGAIGSGLTNYNINYVSGTLTVSPKTLDIIGITADGKAYDGTTTATIHTAGAEIQAGEVVAGDDVGLDASGATGAFADPNVGTNKSVHVTGLTLTAADAANYTTATDLTADISAASLTITAKNVGMTYADGTTLNDSHGFTTSGLVGSDSVSSLTLTTDATLSGSGNWSVGSWSITPGAAVGSGLGNYTITYDPGTLTVNAKSITVTGVTAQSKVYNGTDTATLNTSAAALSGAVTGDDVALSSSGTSATFPSANAGTNLAVTAVGFSLTGNDVDNYSLSQPAGLTANITPARLTVTGVVAQSKVYDGTTAATLNTSQAILSGIVNNDHVSVSPNVYTATFASKDVGNNVAVTVSGLSLTGSAQANYTLTQPTGLTANIAPASLTLTASATTMTYGATVPHLSYTTVGLVNNETSATALTGSLATSATSASHVGNYGITQGTLAAVDGNYTITFHGANLVVTPAALTITPNNASKVFGAALPGFSVAYSGFVNGDSASSLTTTPVVTTMATATSPVGSYGLNASGASSPDYTISYAPGSLVVSAAGTQSALTIQTVRNERGRIVSVNLVSQVLVVSPGGGVPGGVVTFFRKAQKVKTIALNGGRAILNGNLNRVLNKSFSVQYSGNGDFTGSTSARLKVTRAAVRAAAALATGPVKHG